MKPSSTPTDPSPNKRINLDLRCELGVLKRPLFCQSQAALTQWPERHLVAPTPLSIALGGVVLIAVPSVKLKSWHRKAPELRQAVCVQEAHARATQAMANLRADDREPRPRRAVAAALRGLVA